MRDKFKKQLENSCFLLLYGIFLKIDFYYDRIKLEKYERRILKWIIFYYIREKRKIYFR